MKDGIRAKKATILKAIADPTRMKILELLKDGERCVCEMVPLLNEKQPNLSKHLSLLRHTGIVEFRKDGVSSYYRLAHPEVLDIVEIAERIVKKETTKTFRMVKGKRR